MANIRLIARLDVKVPNLIKGIHLEGLRVIGEPKQFARKYYGLGIDEIIYMDCVASLYGRNSLSEIVSETARQIFVPITVGGGIRSTDDVKQMLRCGADKVAINTAAISDPELITAVSRRFGSQCMVLSIEAKQKGDSNWEAYTDNGREHSGRDVVEWAKEAVERGAGEILLTSVDREGTRKGTDISLIKAVSDSVNVPVIASGGVGRAEDIVNAVKDGHADAIAMADILHYDRVPLDTIRQTAFGAGLDVRMGH